MHSKLTSLLLTLAASPSSTANHAAEFRFRLIDNLVYIPVAVDRHPGWGVLDTGTDAVVIDESFARRAGVPKGRPLGDAGASGTHAVPMWRATLPSLDAPGLRLGNLTGRILDTGFYTRSAGFPVDVIVGPDFFRHRVVSIDYPRRSLTIMSGPSARLHCSEPTKFRLVEGTPVIDARASFDGGRTSQKLQLMVDLGTRHQAMLLDDRFLATAAGRTLRRSSAPRRISTGAGGPVFGWPSTAASLTIGSRSRSRVAYAASAQLGSSPYDGFLGVPFWKNGVIGFDYDRRLLCLPDADPAERR